MNGNGRRRVVIMGAAGRDFHNFNTLYRDRDDVEVVCFTETQIPDIAGREYPAKLAGDNYPEGIPIKEEKDITEIIKEQDIDEVVLSYSDLYYIDVMRKAARVNAAGAKFTMVPPEETMIESEKKVIAVTAARTGAGKSQTSRKILKILREKDIEPAVIRHPMPYGDLEKQEIQKFEDHDDLEEEECTIEEREEYEQYLDLGATLYAGVDYHKILEEAEKESEVILWDGGNNDTPFYKPDHKFTMFDPLRPGHETKYYPGEINMRLCDTAIINKVGTAKKKDVREVKENIRKSNPNARIVKAESQIEVDNPSLIEDKKVLIIEDGPTLTHGEMKYGAGYIAAQKHNSEIIDPSKYAVGSLKKTYRKYNLAKVLPAMGYSPKQISELERTVNKADCDAVIIGTPINLRKFININKPSARVTYKLEEKTEPGIEKEVNEIIDGLKN